MESMMLAILVIVAGAAAWVIGPSVAGAAHKGHAKLAGAGLMLAGVAVAGLNTVIVIDAGEVGVQKFLGVVKAEPLRQGVRVINPLATVEIMSIREQSFPPGGGVESIEAQTSEQMNFALEVSMIFKIDAIQAPDLF